MFTPSPQQSTIFSHLSTFPSNLQIQACAGSGKTTTLVEGLKCLPVRDTASLLSPSTLFLAFNKSIAETLATRCPRHVQCSTFHSLGFRALKRVLGAAVKVESRKVPKLVYNIAGYNHSDVQSIIKLVSLAKTQPPQAEVDWDALAEKFDVSISEPSESFRHAEKALLRSNEDQKTIDFDDMLWMPVLLGASFDKQDYVFVDEAQDTNDIQLEILQHLAKPSTRYAFVGDPHQAIYGFRGANSDSMSRIASRFSCTTLPLSVSYRCPKAIIAEAQKYIK